MSGSALPIDPERSADRALRIHPSSNGNHALERGHALDRGAPGAARPSGHALVPGVGDDLQPAVRPLFHQLCPRQPELRVPPARRGRGLARALRGMGREGVLLHRRRALHAPGPPRHARTDAGAGAGLGPDERHAAPGASSRADRAGRPRIPVLARDPRLSGWALARDQRPDPGRRHLRPRHGRRPQAPRTGVPPDHHGHAGVGSRSATRKSGRPSWPVCGTSATRTRASRSFPRSGSDAKPSERAPTWTKNGSPRT